MADNNCLGELYGGNKRPHKMSTLQRLFYDWKILMSLKKREREIGVGWFCRKMQRLHWSLPSHRERHFLRTSRLNDIFFLFPLSYFHSTFSQILCAVLFPASQRMGWSAWPGLHQFCVHEAEQLWDFLQLLCQCDFSPHTQLMPNLFW